MMILVFEKGVCAILLGIVRYMLTVIAIYFTIVIEINFNLSSFGFNFPDQCIFRVFKTMEVEEIFSAAALPLQLIGSRVGFRFGHLPA
jgi:hypothetical protein